MARRSKRRRKKKTINQQLYAKQRKRLSSLVTRLRKQGYDVSLEHIAGKIPKRITKKEIERLSKIRRAKDVIKDFNLQKITFDDDVDIPISDEDLIIQNFKDQFIDHARDVQDAVYSWMNYVIEEYGFQEFSDALDTAEYEGVNLSSYGGYLVDPGDLALYLHKLSHFIIGNENSPPLEELTNKVESIISNYTAIVDEAELSSFGSWHKKRPKWAKG